VNSPACRTSSGRSNRIHASPRGLLIASTYDNEARVFDAAGRLIRIVRPVAPPPVEVTDAEIAARKALLIENAPPQLRAEHERIYADMPAPPTHPPFVAAYLGDDGTIWILLEAPTPNADEQPALVYAADGELLGGARLPTALSVTEISRERVVGVWQDSLGIESVRAFAVVETR
jgi:hypothetical protein